MFLELCGIVGPVTTSSGVTPVESVQEGVIETATTVGQEIAPTPASVAELLLKLQPDTAKQALLAHQLQLERAVNALLCQVFPTRWRDMEVNLRELVVTALEEQGYEIQETL